ncbi:hypothetical protein COOONC_26936 [Cooperia oncophora]
MYLEVTTAAAAETRPFIGSDKLLIVPSELILSHDCSIPETSSQPYRYVLDVTIAYPNGIPLSLATLGFGTREKCDIAVNYKIYDASEVGVSFYLGRHCLHFSLLITIYVINSSNFFIFDTCTFFSRNQYMTSVILSECSRKRIEKVAA